MWHLRKVVVVWCGEWKVYGGHCVGGMPQAVNSPAIRSMQNKHVLFVVVPLRCCDVSWVADERSIVVVMSVGSLMKEQLL